MGIPPWAYAGAGVIAIAGGFAGGYYLRDLQCDKAALAKELAAVDKGEAAQEVVDTEAREFEEERQDAQTVHTERTNTIRTIYRNIEVPASCEPPADALGVLNSAVRSANAAATGESSGGLRDHRPGADPVR